MNNELGQFIPVHYHFQMLSDHNRTQSFKKAIEHAVRDQSQVVELGCGTGIMSFFAAKQGGNVTGVEYNPSLIEKAQELIKRNGVESEISLVNADAKDWMADDPVDVVICEMLHSALLREKQLEVLDVFAKKHFDRFGKMPRFIPEVTMLGVQAVYQNYEFEGYSAPIPLFYDPYISSNHLKECSSPAVYDTIIYDQLNGRQITCDVLMDVQKACSINALRFITKNLLYINRISGETIDWHNQYMVLPLKETMKVKGHQQIRVQFTYEAGEAIELLEKAIKVEIIGE